MNSEHRQTAAIVTGCGRRNGIGAGVARRLAGEGMRVVLCDIVGGGEDLDDIVAEIIDAGGTAAGARGDVSSEIDCAALVAEATERFGVVSVLVNNAAAPHGADRARLADVPLDAWQRQLDVNLTGAFLMTRAVAPAMIEQHYGRIVNVASVAALIGGAKRTAYSASKAGIIGLTRGCAGDLAPEGITVNAICPGAIATARAASGANRQGQDAAAAEAKIAASNPVRRVGNPADIAAAVSYLTSPDAGYVTGQVLAVDGGASTVRA